MKKLIIMFLISTSLTFATPTGINASRDNADQCSLHKNSLLAFLNPHLQNAVEKYYTSLGKQVRMFALYDANIVSIQNEPKGSFMFKATVELKTFTGPHNPPEGLEVISLIYASNGVVKITDYKHQELTFFHHKSKHRIALHRLEAKLQCELM